MDNCISQGYTYIKNGMQGTLKSIREFNRNNDPISAQTYLYNLKKVMVSDYKYHRSLTKMEPFHKIVNVPDNNLLTISKDGKLSRKTVGETADIWVNSSKNETEDESTTWTQLNVAFMATFTFQNLMPIFGLPQNYTYFRDKRVSVNKVINKLPVLQYVKTRKGQSEIVTE